MVTDEYEATSTPGRYFHHIPSMCLSAFLCLSFIDMLPLRSSQVCFLPADWSLDVDAYVVHVNYSEYSLMIMNIEKATGENCTSVKLYSE